MNTLPQRRSPRLQGYDYTQSGAYFVTICTHNRTHLFGQISDAGEMQLSAAGEIVQQCWVAIPEHFLSIELDAFVVMPNHIHGILVLQTNVDDGRGGVVGNDSTVSQQSGALFGRPLPGALSTVIRSYKSIVTRTIRAMTNSEIIVWQGRYHDHIIRNEADLNTIRQYVVTNPVRWQEDTFYSSPS